MKLVILDGFALNPGDLCWDVLQPFGELTVHDRTPAALTVERARGAAVLFTNKTVLTDEVLSQLPGLRYVGLLSTGTNAVDLAAARRLGVAVTNVPAYSTPSVTQMVFAHLLDFATHARQHAESVRAGRWTTSRDFCFWEHPLTELAGCTMGIVGFGQIGQAVARVAIAFGMRVLAFTWTPNRPVPHDLQTAATNVSLDDLLTDSDVVTLHVPLTDATAGLINRETLRRMKPTAYLINTGRGGLVVEPDLAAALNAGTLAGAGVDVLSTEPPAADNPLLHARNITITPHIAWATLAARTRLLQVVVENLRAFLAGSPTNVVS
jgi:glycerate dehydrogenase